MQQEPSSHHNYIWCWNLHFSTALSLSVEQELSLNVIPALIVIYYALIFAGVNPQCHAEQEEMRLVLFKAEVPVSFTNPHSSDLAGPRRAAVQVDHLCSLLPPTRRRGPPAPRLAFAVKPTGAIPAVKALHYRLHFSPLPRNLRHTPGVFLTFIFRLWKGSRCIVLSSAAGTNGSKRTEPKQGKVSGKM